MQQEAGRVHQRAVGKKEYGPKNRQQEYQGENEGSKVV